MTIHNARFFAKSIIGLLILLLMFHLIILTNSLHYELQNIDKNPMISSNIFLFVIIFILIIFDLIRYLKTKAASSGIYVRNVVYFLLLFVITSFSVARVFVDSMVVQ